MAQGLFGRAVPEERTSVRKAIVVGAGVAGLSTALAFLRAGLGAVHVFDREGLPFSGSSGRSAGIFRPLEEDRELVALAARSLELIRELEARHQTPILHPTGLALVHDRASRLERIARVSSMMGIECELQSADTAGLSVPLKRALRRLPASHAGRHVLWSAVGGVLDTSALGLLLWKEVKSLGGVFHMHTDVAELIIDRDRCTGIVATDGESHSCDVVVNAAGAQSGRLGCGAGSPMPLIPLQRHLALLRSEEEPEPRGPVVWNLNPETYFRPESGGLLACCCDETPRPQGEPQASLMDLSNLCARLNPGGYQVQRYWAGVRTMTPDARPIVGADPEIGGFFWLAGLGGFGMSCGLAAGEHLARIVAQQVDARALSPARFRHSPLGENNAAAEAS